MPNIVESKTEIQIDVPLTEVAKGKCAKEFLDAMVAIQAAQDDIKVYVSEKKEELEKYNAQISETRSRANDTHLPDAIKLELAQEIIAIMNTVSEIEDDLESFKTDKKHEITKNEAIMNICRGKISRGKERKWVEVKMLKDFDKKIKTYADLKTGEIVKTVPMTNDDLQMPLESE